MFSVVIALSSGGPVATLNQNFILQNQRRITMMSILPKKRRLDFVKVGTAKFSRQMKAAWLPFSLVAAVACWNHVS
jgi:hypothetical protein